MHRHNGQFIPGLKLAVVCLFLAACDPNTAEQQPTDDQPAESVAADSPNVIHRTVPFVTLRNKTGSTAAGEYFGNERSSVHTGYCEVSWTPIPMMETIASNTPFYIPFGRLRLEDVYEDEEQNFWRKFTADAVEYAPLLYIHGYKIGFERGCGRAAVFQENLHLTDRLLFFSWPSDDAALNYTHDESDIYWSVPYIEQTLGRLLGLFGAGNVDVVAHSMGTRGASLALVRMSDQHGLETPLLNHLVLLAADIDAGIFEQYLEVIRPLVRRITIYVSDNDSALSLSEELHGYPRLGAVGPHLLGLDGIEIIDVSPAGRRRASGHLYHLYNELVLNDLDQLLNEDRPASSRSGLQPDRQMGMNHWKLIPPGTD